MVTCCTVKYPSMYYYTSFCCFATHTQNTCCEEFAVLPLHELQESRAHSFNSGVNLAPKWCMFARDSSFLGRAVISRSDLMWSFACGVSYTERSSSPTPSPPCPPPLLPAPPPPPCPPPPFPSPSRRPLQKTIIQKWDEARRERGRETERDFVKGEPKWKKHAPWPCRDKNGVSWHSRLLLLWTPHLEFTPTRS